VFCQPGLGRPYRAVANLRNIFLKIMATAFSPELLAATYPPQKNTRFAARKIARTLAAFSLPQDS
jgi:hypothetical protein